ncbi:MAG: hypothetical protein ABEJ55_07310 [Halanaeroarchaeum sp.]
MSRDATDVRERFWSRVCAFRRLLQVVAAIEILLLVLLAYAWVVGVERGSATHHVLLIDLAVIVPTLAAVIAVYWRCRHREPF